VGDARRFDFISVVEAPDDITRARVSMELRAHD